MTTPINVLTREALDRTPHEYAKFVDAEARRCVEERLKEMGGPTSIDFTTIRRDLVNEFGRDLGIGPVIRALNGYIAKNRAVIAKNRAVIAKNRDVTETVDHNG